MDSNFLDELFKDRRTPEQKSRDHRKAAMGLFVVVAVVAMLFFLAIVGAIHLVELVKQAHP